VVDERAPNILKIDKSLMRQLVKNLTQGTWGNHPFRNIEFVNGLEQLVKFIPVRAFDEVSQVEDHQWEGE